MYPPVRFIWLISIILFRYRIHFFAEEENLKRQSRFESVRPFPPSGRMIRAHFGHPSFHQRFDNYTNGAHNETGGI